MPKDDSGGLAEFLTSAKGMWPGKSAAKKAPNKPKPQPQSQKDVASSAKSLGYTMNKDGSFTKAGASKAKSGKMKTTVKPTAKKKGK